jgi:hypothetical protein
MVLCNLLKEELVVKFNEGVLSNESLNGGLHVPIGIGPDW